jgi:hypothetical protein
MGNTQSLSEFKLSPHSTNTCVADIEDVDILKVPINDLEISYHDFQLNPDSRKNSKIYISITNEKPLVLMLINGNFTIVDLKNKNSDCFNNNYIYYFIGKKMYIFKIIEIKYKEIEIFSEHIATTTDGRVKIPGEKYSVDGNTIVISNNKRKKETIEDVKSINITITKKIKNDEIIGIVISEVIPSTCVVGNSLVEMFDGTYKNMAQIEIGDFVKSGDETAIIDSITSSRYDGLVCGKSVTKYHPLKNPKTGSLCSAEKLLPAMDEFDGFVYNIGAIIKDTNFRAVTFHLKDFDYEVAFAFSNVVNEQIDSEFWGTTRGKLFHKLQEFGGRIDLDEWVIIRDDTTNIAYDLVKK